MPTLARASLAMFEAGHHLRDGVVEHCAGMTFTWTTPNRSRWREVAKVDALDVVVLSSRSDGVDGLVFFEGLILWAREWPVALSVTRVARSCKDPLAVLELSVALSGRSFLGKPRGTIALGLAVTRLRSDG